MVTVTVVSISADGIQALALEGQVQRIEQQLADVEAKQVEIDLGLRQLRNAANPYNESHKPHVRGELEISIDLKLEYAAAVLARVNKLRYLPTSSPEPFQKQRTDLERLGAFEEAFCGRQS